MDDDLPRISLGPPAPDPDADPLVAIVARYRRRRQRALTAALVVAVVAGPALGFAVGHRSSSTVAATRPNATRATPTPTPGSGGVAAPSSGPPTATRLFVRTTADDVTIRGYLRAFGGMDGGPIPPSCYAPKVLTAELSDDAVASQTGSSPLVLPDPNPVTVVSRNPVGITEGSPIATVTVQAAAGVATVVATFGDGSSDQMAPVDGWAVLAHRVPTLGAALSSADSVRALDANGAVLASVPTTPAQPSPECEPKPPAPGSGGVVTPSHAVNVPSTTTP
jgi:hypothetical protein